MLSIQRKRVRGTESGNRRHPGPRESSKQVYVNELTLMRMGWGAWGCWHRVALVWHQFRLLLVLGQVHVNCPLPVSPAACVLANDKLNAAAVGCSWHDGCPHGWKALWKSPTNANQNLCLAFFICICETSSAVCALTEDTLLPLNKRAKRRLACYPISLLLSPSGHGNA